MSPPDVRGKIRNLAQRLRTPKVRVGTHTPVFLICRDRVAPLSQLVYWLEAEGFENLVLVDNDSTYPPLLEFYEETPHRVVRLGRNVGHHSPWLPELAAIRGDRDAYVVSDPDVIPEPLAGGAVQRFADLLNRYPGYAKAGFGLRIDDLPDRYAHRDAVLRWEAEAWQREVEPGVFHAPIDTTFALYRAGAGFSLGPALRTGAPFLAKHEPWYRVDAHTDEELTYYYARAQSSDATWRPDAKDDMYDDRSGSGQG